MMTQQDKATDLIRVFILDDHPIVRHGLKQLINQQPDMQVCGEAERVSDAIGILDETKPNVALVDLALPEGNGMDVVRHVKDRWIGVKTIVVSTCDASTYAPIALEAGADGFVNKHEAMDKIIDAIHCVQHGRKFFNGSGAEKASRWFG